MAARPLARLLPDRWIAIVAVPRARRGGTSHVIWQPPDVTLGPAAVADRARRHDQTPETDSPSTIPATGSPSTRA